MNHVVKLKNKQCYFSDNINDEVSIHLKRISTLSEFSEKENELKQLINKWPESLDAYIALFKLYFRSGLLRQAELFAQKPLKQAAKQTNLPQQFITVSLEQYRIKNFHSASHIYLYCIKALGVIRLKRGRFHLAFKTLNALAILDPKDDLGGGIFLAACLDIMNKPSSR